MNEDWRRKVLERLKYCKKIFVACSAGADSTALLQVLIDLKLHPEALHCNFQLRGEESAQDERWLYEYCSSVGIPLIVKQIDTQSMRNKMGGSVQLVARKLRYAWFDEILLQHPDSIICTAHHFDDAIEQMLMHLMRSGSLLDLQSIPEERPGYYRPFLNFKKSEIVRYLSEKGISWREDSSNKKNDYTRNKIRNQLLPLMNEIDTRSNLALKRFHKEATQLHEDLEKQIKAWFDQQQNKTAFLMPFSFWDNSLRIWKQKFISILTHTVFSENELEKLRFAENGSVLKIGPYKLIKEKIGFYFEQQTHDTVFDTQIIVPDTIETPQGTIKVNEVSEAIENTPKCVYINPQDIVGRLRIRNTVAGDTILLNGKSSSSKVSKLLINHKLSQEQKRKQLIVCDDEKTFWLVGLCFSSIINEQKHSQKFIQLQIFPK